MGYITGLVAGSDLQKYFRYYLLKTFLFLTLFLDIFWKISFHYLCFWFWYT